MGEESARNEARVCGHVGAALESALHSGCAEAKACARVSGAWAQACVALLCNVQVLAVLAVQRITQFFVCSQWRRGWRQRMWMACAGLMRTSTAACDAHLLLERDVDKKLAALLVHLHGV